MKSLRQRTTLNLQLHRVLDYQFLQHTKYQVLSQLEHFMACPIRIHSKGLSRQVALHKAIVHTKQLTIEVETTSPYGY